jgi:Short C-terminal domain/Bacterial PH domain
LASDKKAMATITESLQPDEQVLGTIHAAYIVSTTNSENTIGTLALTNKRLIFSGSIGLKREQHSSPLQLVTSVDLVKGAMLSHLQVTLAGSVSKYRVKYTDASAFVQATHAAVAAAQTAPASQTSAPSAADELMKLADLHAKGVLTDEEFATAKAKALS